MTQVKINIKNKKAYFDYHIEEKFVAGIMLTGTEIKSIRLGKASLKEAYCKFINAELFIVNMNITEYSWGTYNNHAPKRDRKLLLTKRELKRLGQKTREKGFTIVPLSLFINDKGLAKIEIALAQGKQLHDKREDLKKKDAQREMDRMRKK